MKRLILLGAILGALSVPSLVADQGATTRADDYTAQTASGGMSIARSNAAEPECFGGERGECVDGTYCGGQADPDEYCPCAYCGSWKVRPGEELPIDGCCTVYR